MSRDIDVIEVHADPEWLKRPRRMGWLRRQGSGRGEVFSFEYDPNWLATPDTLKESWAITTPPA